MSEDREDQIHPATPAHQQRLKRQGHYAKSQQVSAAVQIIGGLLIAWSLFEPLAQWLKKLFQTTWREPWTSLAIDPQYNLAETITGTLQQTLFSFLLLMAPIFVLLVAVNIFSHWCQTGPIFLPNKAAPDLERLHPQHALTQMFSLSAFVRPLVYLPKLCLVVGIMAVGLWQRRDALLQLGMMPPDEMGGTIFSMVLAIGGQVAGALLAASMLDYAMNYLSFERRNKMSDQQIRDDAKMESNNVQLFRRRQSND